MEEVITLIFGYKNRETIRVKRCLDSLDAQRNKNFRVLFVDYGSNSQLSSSVKKLVNSYSFSHYIYVDARGWVWNRSHALNIGIRLVETSYIMTTDVDLIFSPDFINDFIEELSGNIELHSSAFSLPKNFELWEKLSKTHSVKFKPREMTALGLVQATDTDVLHEIRGFDENYSIWGVEDFDLNSRLEIKGYKTKWLDLYITPVFHQWHPNSGGRSRGNLPGGWHKMMIDYCEQNINKISRNNLGWGKSPKKGERKILNLLNQRERDKINTLDLTGRPVNSSINVLIHNINKLAQDETLRVIYKDVRLKDIKASKLHSLIKFANKISDKLNLPILLVSDLVYYKNYEDVFDMKDMMMYFIFENKNHISDYYFEETTDRMELIIEK